MNEKSFWLIFILTARNMAMMSPSKALPEQAKAQKIVM
jgi:hypothetical protein